MILSFSVEQKRTQDWLQSNCKLNSVDNICKQSKPFVIDKNKIAHFISARGESEQGPHRYTVRFNSVMQLNSYARVTIHRNAMCWCHLFCARMYALCWICRCLRFFISFSPPFPYCESPVFSFIIINIRKIEQTKNVIHRFARSHFMYIQIAIFHRIPCEMRWNEQNKQHKNC